MGLLGLSNFEETEFSLDLYRLNLSSLAVDFLMVLVSSPSDKPPLDDFLFKFIF